MFDLRYHVASLAAVFLALIIGILVGVGLSSGGFLKKSERSLLNKQIADLQTRVDVAGDQIDQLSRSQRAAQIFIKETYPALMEDRLLGRRVALVFVGPVDPRVRDLVKRALSDAGAPGLLRIRALKVPFDVAAVDHAIARRPALIRYSGDIGLADLGRALAQELVAGTTTSLWPTVSQHLVLEQLGPDKKPVDAVVVVRSVDPQRGLTARFLAGFYAGLTATGVPAVGVETTGAPQSAVDAFAKAHLSSIDDVDIPAGRLALAVLLAGGKPGQYGLKETARSGMLPPVEPVSAPARRGG